MTNTKRDMVLSVLSSLSESLVEDWEFLEAFEENGSLVGAQFRVSDGNGNDFKFALSGDSLSSVPVVKSVWFSIIKFSEKTRVVMNTDGEHVRCVREKDCIEKRESNLHWLFDPQQSKEGYVFIDGGKYKACDVVVFDLFQTIADAVIACKE